MPISYDIYNNFHAAGLNSRFINFRNIKHLDLSFPMLTFCDPRATGHAKCDLGPGSRLWLRRVSLLDGKAQLAGCQENRKVIRWTWTQVSSDNVQLAVI